MAQAKNKLQTWFLWLFSVFHAFCFSRHGSSFLPICACFPFLFWNCLSTQLSTLSFVVSFYLLCVFDLRPSGCISTETHPPPLIMMILSHSLSLITFTSLATHLPQYQSFVHMIASCNSIRYQPGSHTSTSLLLANHIAAPLKTLNTLIRHPCLGLRELDLLLYEEQNRVVAGYWSFLKIEFIVVSSGQG